MQRQLLKTGEPIAKLILKLLLLQCVLPAGLTSSNHHGSSHGMELPAGLFTVINEPVAVFIRCGVFVHVFLIVSLKETLLTHYPVNLGCLPPW